MKKCLIQEKDYDRYMIPVSIKNLLGNFSRKYVFEELEKRHPCFNDSFSFDSALVIKKRRLYLDVFVINKFKLMEYKKKSIFSFLGFRMERQRTGLKFSNKRILFIIYSFLLILVIFIAFGFKYLQPFEINNIENFEPVQSVEEIKEETNLTTTEVISQILESVTENSGKISSFTWIKNHNQEEIKLSVNNIYPENFKDFINKEYISVEYVAGTPKFDFRYRFQTDYMAPEYDKNSFFEADISLIRNLIKKNGCSIIREQDFPFEFVFTSNDFAILSDLEIYLEKNRLSVNELSIKSNENGVFLMEVKLTDLLKNSNYVLHTLIGRENLFTKETKRPQENKVKETIKKVDMEKIGKIKYGNGNYLVFYKDHNGKLLKVIEEM